MRTAVALRNSLLQDAGDQLDNGFVRFYDGPVPVDPDTALSGNTMIVQCALSAPAFGTVSNGIRTSNPITAGIIAASGTPTFARFFRSDGTSARVDMDVPGEIILSKEAWVAGEPFPGPSITWTMAVGP